MIHMIKSIWAPDKQVKIFSNSVSISPWYLINSDLGVEKTKYLQKLSGWNDTAESETPAISPRGQNAHRGVRTENSQVVLKGTIRLTPFMGERINHG